MVLSAVVLLFLLALARSADSQCEVSVTTVHMRPVCKGELIFSDEFNSINRSLWQHEIFIPVDTPDLQFNYYDDNPVNSFTQNGRIVIKPTIHDEEFVRRGTLDLAKCTGTTNQQCTKTAKSFSILPPARTARLTTKNSFSFKYGRIDIRAKLPEGDWLVPELWLVPKSERYGEGLKSGRIRMVAARGNVDLALQKDSSWTMLGSDVLESNLFLSSGGKVLARTVRIQGANSWQPKAYTYSYIWRPDGFQLLVDGEEVGRLVPVRYAGQLSALAGFTPQEANIWASGSSMAPFDQEFYLSIGLSVGGVNDFPDGVVDGSNEKPWRNFDIKMLRDFWLAKDKWAPTWDSARHKNALSIFSIKVYALS